MAAAQSSAPVPEVTLRFAGSRAVPEALRAWHQTQRGLGFQVLLLRDSENQLVSVTWNKWLWSSHKTGTCNTWRIQLQFGIIYKPECIGSQVARPTVFPCDPGSLAGPWSSLTLTTLILSQNLKKATAISTPDGFWSLSACRFCFRNLQAAFRPSSSLSYSAPRAASPWAGFPAEDILQNLKFLPSPLQQNTPGAGPTAMDPTINLTHLTTPNESLSKNEEVEAQHSTRFKVSCLKAKLKETTAIQSTKEIL